MNKINPESTIAFSNRIKLEAMNGTYRVTMGCNGKNILLDIFPEVFPPQTELLLGKYLKNVSEIKNIEVADVGTGSGVEAICAALLGAKHIDAIDINPIALECTRQNSRLNNVEEKITVISSDLFSNIAGEKKYGLILANLPFIDYAGGDDPISIALYDDGHAIHKNFLQQAKLFLAKDGRILLPHANLQSGNTKDPDLDFEILEKMILDAGYKLQIIAKKPFRTEFSWRLYELKI
jgi:methylase of polypeptide subunit release factors